MKKLILVVLLSLAFTIPCMAITPEQLKQAEETLRQMDGKISVLRGYVQQAYNGVVEGITLTIEQKQELKSKYIAEKSGLVDLYNQLP